MNYHKPDLTLHPPRSPRVRLGGYALLARCLDKCRATLAKKNGEYHYACALDQMFFEFAGISAAAFKKAVAKGLSDTEVVAWVQTNSKNDHSDAEIAIWSQTVEKDAPCTNDERTYFSKMVASAKALKREDLVTWCDMLDMDDYVSFGGKA